MIRLDDVAFTHLGETLPALDGVRLDVAAGEVVVVTGPSGCGKTTLTRAVNGLIPHLHQGTLTGGIAVAGTAPNHGPLFETARIVGTVFQNPRTQFFATEVLSELAFGAENAGIPPTRIRTAIAETLDRFGLTPLADRSVFDLSGGQKQLLACASVDVLRPPVLVLDEPTANLDAAATRRIAEVIAGWKHEGRTVLIAEHRVGWLLGVADRVVVMDAGCIVAEFTAKAFAALTPEVRARWGLRDPRAESMEGVPLGALTSSVPSERGIELSDVEVHYGRRATRAVDLDSATLPKGQIVAITGPNGAGKSSLARFLVGLRGGGRVVRDGVRLSARRRRRMSAIVMQDVGHQLFAESVLSEVELAQGRRDRMRARELLEAVDLSRYADRHPLALSTGERQRLAVAVAIAGDRRIVVFDEPTSGLDRAHMEQVGALLQILRDRGTDVFVMTHDREFVEQAATWRAHLARAGLMIGPTR